MKVTITCDNCGSTFEREAREIKRSLKKGRKNFCSRKCCGIANVHNVLYSQSNYDVSQHSNNRKDKYTGVRTFLRRAKMRHHEVDIDLDDLLKCWNDQDGKCMYTNIQLV